MSKQKENWYKTIMVRRERAGEELWLQGYNRTGDATQRSLTRAEARREAGQRGCKAKFHAAPSATVVAPYEAYAVAWGDEEGEE